MSYRSKCLKSLLAGLSPLLLASAPALAFQYAEEISDPNPTSSNELGLSLEAHEEWLVTGTTQEHTDSYSGRIRLYRNDQFVRYYTARIPDMLIGNEHGVAISDSGLFTLGDYVGEKYLLAANKTGDGFQTYFSSTVYLGPGRMSLAADGEWVAVTDYEQNKVSLIRKMNGYWRIADVIYAPFDIGGADMNDGRLAIAASGNRIQFYKKDSSSNWVLEQELDTGNQHSALSFASVSSSFAAFIDGTEVEIYQRTWDGWSHFQTLAGTNLGVDIEDSRLVVNELISDSGPQDREAGLYELRGKFERIGQVHVDADSGTIGQTEATFGRQLKIEGNTVYVADRNALYPEDTGFITPGVIYSFKWWYIY